jgi:hypothetical protein
MWHCNISTVRTTDAWLRCKPRTPGRLCSHKHCTDTSALRLYEAALQKDRQTFVLSPGGQSGTETGSAACRCHSISTPHSHTPPTLPHQSTPSLQDTRYIGTFRTGQTLLRNLPLDCNPPHRYNHPGIRMRAWESFSCVKPLENRGCVPLFSMKCRGKE